MNLTKKVILNHGDEGKAPIRKKVNNAKKAYYLFLILSVLYIIQIFIYNSIEIKGTGNIVIPTYNIKAKRDSTILNLDLLKGDIINAKDFLFKSKYEEIISSTKTSFRDFSYDKNIFSLRSQINKKTAEIKYIKDKMRKEELFYSLDLYNNNNVENLTNRNKLNLYYGERKALRQNLKELKKLKKIAFKNRNSLKTNSRTYLYTAPRGGKIISIFNKNYDFVLKGDDVLVIGENSKGYIEGYFEPSKIQYLKLREKIKIILPNKKEIMGIISNIESASIGNKAKLSYSYIPSSTSIKVKIVLEDYRESHLLEEFNQMSIKLRIYKWHF